MRNSTCTECYAMRCLCLMFYLVQCGLFACASPEVLPATNGHELNCNTVYDVYTSDAGYVWVATDAGISRYDGFRFRNFPLTFRLASLSYPLLNAVRSIKKGEGNTLYLSLLQGGVACFDTKRETYIPVRMELPFETGEITAVYFGEDHFISIGTAKGLYIGTIRREQGKEEEIIRVHLSDNPVVEGEVSNICGDQDEIFAYVDGSGIWRYNPAIGKAEVMQACETPPAFYLQERYLWICSSPGTIMCYDRKRKMLIRTIEDKKAPGRMALSDTEIKAMTAVDDTTFYIATWNGLFRLVFDTKDITKAGYKLDIARQKGNQIYSALSGKLSALCWNRALNILWVASYGNGIMKLDYTQDIYSRLQQHFDTDIRGIVQDMQGYVWLTVRQRGVWRSTTKSFSANSVFEPWTKGVEPDGNYCLYKDRNGFLWLGSEASKVTCINPLSGEGINYAPMPEGATDLRANIRQFCVDTRNRLWIVTTGGLLLFDSKTGKCRTVALEEDASVKEVFCIAEDGNGSIWIGTNSGVKRMEFLNGKVKLHGGYEKKVGLEGLSAFLIYVNNYNQILVSYSNKMLCIDGRDKKEKEEDVSVTVMNGMSNGFVFSIVDDLNGNTWFGDNSGIVTLRNDGSLFYRYPLIGGCDKVCRLRDGRLLWVNAGGLLFFDPLVTKSNRYMDKNRLVLSELKVDGELVAVGEPVEGKVILEVAPDLQRKFVFYTNNKDVVFYFSDLQYDGEFKKITYRLLPDGEWTFGSLEEGISLKNLPVGDYVLQAKLVFPDTSESGTLEVPIIMKNYWWRTGWAYGGYFLVFLGAMLGLYYYLDYKSRRREANKMRELELKEMLNLAKMKQEQNQKMENMRDRLLALFVQELRTPLSLIIAPLKELVGEALSSEVLAKVQVAYRNSVYMLDACNQLLSIYTEKPLKSKLEVSLYPIDRLIDESIFPVKELIRVNHIDFRYNRKVAKNLEIYVDARRICFILHNLLSNAFNHIHFSGMVTLSVSEMQEEGIRYCSISILDSGKQKVKEARRCLLDTEEEFSEDISAVELGFEFMEKIVKSHHGFMKMSSEEGEGTEIVLNIPIEKVTLENDPNIVFVTRDLKKEPDKASEPVVNVTSVSEVVTQSEAAQQEIARQEVAQAKKVQEEVTQEIRETSSASKKKTLLIIEDHKDIRLYLKVLFSKEYDILVAVNGQEGVDMAQREQPDLILCDVMMPVKDGFECCKEIKEGLDTCHIPFILLTAKVEDEDVIHGLEMGADDYILKPFTPGILKAKVRNLINGRITLKQMYTRLLVLPDAENEKKEGEEENVGDPFINMVIKIVEDNIREPDFSVKKLASEMNMSQPTLYRKIKQTTDFTIIELIRGVRMRRAAIILKQKRHAVQEVAEMVGYNDIPTFRKHFVDAFGTTPSTYANMAEGKE